MSALATSERPSRVMGQTDETRSLIDAIIANIEAGRAVERPFFHLEFDRVFPDDVYARIIAAMPSNADYRAEPGHDRTRDDDAQDPHDPAVPARDAHELGQLRLERRMALAHDFDLPLDERDGRAAA